MCICVCVCLLCLRPFNGSVQDAPSSSLMDFNIPPPTILNRTKQLWKTNEWTYNVSAKCLFFLLNPKSVFATDKCDVYLCASVAKYFMSSFETHRWTPVVVSGPLRRAVVWKGHWRAARLVHTSSRNARTGMDSESEMDPNSICVLPCFLHTFSKRGCSGECHHTNIICIEADETVAGDDASSRKPIRLDHASKKDAARTTFQTEERLMLWCFLQTVDFPAFNGFLVQVIYHSNAEKCTMKTTRCGWAIKEALPSHTELSSSLTSGKQEWRG